jgi:dUTP pyrophosphatase
VSVSVKVKRLEHGRDLELPAYASAGAAGADLRAAVTRPLVIGPGDRVAVPTGLVLEVPKGYEAQVRPRSGLSFKKGVTVVNAPGTIDSDYRGELKILLVNVSPEPVTIERGDRVAQMVIAPVTRVEFTEAGDLSATDRGEGGFGSTGR